MKSFSAIHARRCSIINSKLDCFKDFFKTSRHVLLTNLRQYSSDDTPPKHVSLGYHDRKHGNKSLPLSSFLDPARIQQRQQARHRLPKQDEPSFKDLDPFRQRLTSNPFGGSMSLTVALSVLG